MVVDTALTVHELLGAHTRHFGQGVRPAQRRTRSRVNLRCLPTGCAPLDRLLGGLPRGAITELFGAEASGKSTLALAWVARAQRAGAVVLWIDADHVLTSAYALALGVNRQRLLVSRPASGGEEALGVAETLIASGGIDLVVIDSVAALAPRRELNGELELSRRDHYRRFLLQAVHRLTPYLKQNGTALLLLNQTRTRPGRVIGPAERTIGEAILGRAAALRIEVAQGRPIHDGPRLVGHHLVLRVVRNPLGVRAPSTVMVLNHGRGPSRPPQEVSHAAR